MSNIQNPPVLSLGNKEKMKVYKKHTGCKYLIEDDLAFLGVPRSQEDFLFLFMDLIITWSQIL